MAARRFTAHTQLMENAFPAGQLKLDDNFCVVKDVNGEHMIFGTESNCLCLVVKGLNGHNQLINLTQTFGISEQHSVRALAVTQNNDGKIHLVFSVSRPKGTDHLYVLQPMPAVPSEWAKAELKTGLYPVQDLGAEVHEILLVCTCYCHIFQEIY